MDKLYFQWHITNLCNYRCRHCYQDKFDAQEELNIEGLKEVVDRVVCFAKENDKKITINITGGEPFLKKEFFLLLDYLEKHNQIEKLAIITNGSRLDKNMIENLRKYNKVKEIKFSLEGASSQTNDPIRGEGSFETVWKAIRLVKQNSLLKCLIMFTVLKSNIEELPLLFTQAKENNLDGIILERFFPLGRGRYLRDETLTSQDWYNFLKKLLSLNNFSLNLEDMLPYRAFWIKFGDRRTELFGAVCNVGKDAFCIMPDADVYPCRRFILRLGNLLENSLEEIINSQLLKSITEERKRGRCLDCDIRECVGCPAFSYLMSGDWREDGIQCWYRR